MSTHCTTTAPPYSLHPTVGPTRTPQLLPTRASASVYVLVHECACLRVREYEEYAQASRLGSRWSKIGSVAGMF